MKAFLVLVVIASFAVSNCRSVASYEKEHLADRIMLLNADIAESDFETHWLEAREGGRTKALSQGGGCACN